ncbi:hypothetical protein UNDKW_1444 [Undibacterium sp. KW1]|uniref:hypothetical protein n=1 Tax=Undibacterium sp. KW1 TaxID=2058624 RepID=UPI001331C6E7|nr:hypothetical protein [Undibacterium sp. KW1]BBB59717.1 hypothetical protein UNDKW_1444 [Undibacterium sp. KW1]
MQRGHERFGVPEENLRAAKKWAEKQKNTEISQCYVPTRKEVAKLGRQKITKILVNWMCHSPVEIIPSRSQIVEVRDILLAREDASSLSNVITMCNYYIAND